MVKGFSTVSRDKTSRSAITLLFYSLYLGHLIEDAIVNGC